MTILIIVLATAAALGWVKAVGQEQQIMALVTERAELRSELRRADLLALEQARRINNLRSEVAWRGGVS